MAAPLETAIGLAAVVDMALFGGEIEEPGPDGAPVKRRISAGEARQRILSAAASGVVDSVLGVPEIPGDIRDAIEAADARETMTSAARLAEQSGRISPDLLASFESGNSKKRVVEASSLSALIASFVAGGAALLSRGLRRQVGEPTAGTERLKLITGTRKNGDPYELKPMDDRWKGITIDEYRERKRAQHEAEIAAADERKARTGKRPNNPHGGDGGPAHVARVLEIQEMMAGHSDDFIHIAGGTKDELQLPVPKGLKNHRRPDLVYMSRRRPPSFLIFEAGKTDRTIAPTTGRRRPTRHERDKAADYVKALASEMLEIQEADVRFSDYLEALIQSE